MNRALISWSEVVSRCAIAICLLYIVIAVSPAQEVRPWLPNVMSQFPNVRDMTVSPDGREYAFTVESPRKEMSAIVFMRLENGRWSPPAVAPFSGQYRDIEPAFAPNGLDLFFASRRPADKSSTAPKDYDIWVVHRTSENAPWSEPENPGEPVNSTKDEFYPSLTMWGDLYFTRESSDPARKEDIFVSRHTNGTYSVPEPLSDSVNSDHYEFNAFVAPDESFLLFTSYARDDDMGGGDLYISYRQGQQWSRAQHLGGVNSPRIDYCPFVDTRNNLLYFTSERSSIPDHFESRQDLPSLLQRFRSGAVGAGRIYVTSFIPWMQSEP